MAISALASLSTAQSTDLGGTWRFELDRGDRGLEERWFTRSLAATAHLPGSLSAQGIGDAPTVDTKWTGGIFDRSWFTAAEYAPYRQPDHLKVPFWLQPEHHYVGAAWFQRDIETSADWRSLRLVLTLERPHWKTTVWLDNRRLGSQDSLSTPHVYELGVGVRPGAHVITIRVDNTLDPDIGENSHSVSDHTQGNWLGVVGAIKLTASPTAWIDDLQVTPRAADRTVYVEGRVAAAIGARRPKTVRIAAGLLGATPRAALRLAVEADGRFIGRYSLGDDAPLWDEFAPRLHELTARLPSGESRTVTFGLRDLSTDGRQLLLNGRPLFLRGALDCAAFPATGFPPTDVAAWKREFVIIRAHGLNHVRFHSWCPPEAAFAAADELGLYLQIEVASWPNWSTTLGDGKPVDSWLDDETDRILRAYGNHPSFIALCACNEPEGVASARWLSGWVARQKARDSRRLYTAGAGWPDVPENDYHIRSEPRIQHWEEGLKSRINALPPETRTDYAAFIDAHRVPIVSHEIGQWCAYPNFSEIPKYTGDLKPKNFEIFRDTLAAHGLAAQARDFLFASGKLQALCYKEDIESALRTPHMGGFQLLGLADFPGQGTALVGVLDAFWEDKGYVTSADFRRFCAATVPLARLEKRVFTADESLVADLDVAHYGATPLAAAQLAWRLQADDGRVVAHGESPAADLPIGLNRAVAHLDLPLDALPTPQRYKLVVTVSASGRTEAENDWDLWLYPRATAVPLAAPAGVVLATALDAAVQQQLAAGAAVVLLIPPAQVAPDPVRGPIALGFSSIFWNTAWTHRQAPHTLGLLCDPHQPALAAFPTDPWSNWQWWYPITHAAPMILDDLPRALTPTVQVIDDWFTNRKLGLIFEARVGPGRLLVTSIDLASDALDPVRRQLRASLLAYAAGADFHPTVEVTVEQLQRLIAH